MKTKSLMFRVSVIASVVSLAGCATLNEIGKNHGTAFGCVSGALLGAAIGASTGDRNTALKGAAVGMGVGCISGHLWQKKIKELEQLAKQENMQIKVETLQQATIPENSQKAATADVGLVAQVQDLEMFPSGSSLPTSSGENQIRKLAKIFAADFDPKASGVVLVVGHTDASGGAQLNQKLSEERALAVGKYLQEAGIDTSRIYYQGAGASRPISTNSSVQGRSENRRIEIVEISSEELLKIRIEKERSNTTYLTHSTTTTGATLKSSASPVVASSSEPKKKIDKRNDSVNFGGTQVTDAKNSIISLVEPKKQSISLVSSAYASNIPISNCALDAPRIGGEVKNLKTGQVLKHNTKEFMNGMNGRPWSDVVNGHQIVLSPVSVLKSDAEATNNPILYVQKNFQTSNKTDLKYQTIVNTYDGENAILYRVFIQGDNKPIECVDLAMSKISSSSIGGEIYYRNAQEQLFVAQYNPKSR